VSRMALVPSRRRELCADRLMGEPETGHMGELARAVVAIIRVIENWNLGGDSNFCTPRKVWCEPVGGQIEASQFEFSIRDGHDVVICLGETYIVTSKISR
jgi:hypothetical protein